MNQDRSANPENLQWFDVLAADDLPEGRVTTVTAGHRTLALTHFEGRFNALDDHCPHQGGPLGEGAIEKGWLRCPWHGWDFHPCTGRAPGGFDDGIPTFPVEVRDGRILVGLEPECPRPETVSDVMTRTMVNWGVRHVFGMVGHSNLGLADALREREQDGDLTYIGIRHEGAAAFAASAYAKLSGRPAACMAIAGPGSTNMLTGLWDAKVDRAPVVALCGQVDTQVLGPGAFQEIDLSSAFEAVSAWRQTVLPTSDHAELVNLALKNAIIRRDVSTLILPDEVQTLPAGEDDRPGAPDGRLSTVTITPPEESVEAAVEAIGGWKRPVIVVGHGARFAMDSVVALAEELGSPVLTTFKAKGQIGDDHPLAAGVLGRSGTPVASWFMNECDGMLVLGASFSNHTGITPKKPLVQVDFDRMHLGKFHRVDVPVWGEISVTARLLRERLAGRTDTVDQRPELADRWAVWRREKERRVSEDRGHGVNSAAVFAALSRQAPDDAVLTVDVGNNAYSFGRYFETRNHSVLMSGYLGSIGFGYPAAIGARCAAPDRPTIAVTGDGGFAQYMGELTTAVKYDLNITHVLLNNDELGKISKEQRAGRWDVWQTDLRNPGFAAYAELCGAMGVRVEEADQLDDALQRAIEHEGPALVEVRCDVDLV